MINSRLVEDRIIVWNVEDSRSLFGAGYYGKPLGIAKPKGTDFQSPLVLDLIEGCYLLENQKIKILQKDGSYTPLSQIKRLCKRSYVDFESKYLVFRTLRDKGYIVTPGIKFGCDFAVYEHGPGIDHAPYLVQVYRQLDEISATGIVLAGRLATTVKKQFILAVPIIREQKVEFIGFDWWRA